MSDPIDHVQTKQHTLRDWLDLHALDHQTCLQIIEAIRREATQTPVRENNAKQRYQALDNDGTWAVAVAAMRDFLPEHQSIIEDTFLNSEKIAIVGGQKSRRALTIDHGPAKYPTILYHLNHDPSDPLVVAHEFGHALQTRASGGTFVPPVIRELCAFLAEGALLSYTRDNDAVRYEALLERWRKDNDRYFGQLTRKLQRALATPNAIYEYGWNYPIARFFALRLSTGFSPHSVWGAFEGDWSIQSVLDKFDI